MAKGKGKVKGLVDVGLDYKDENEEDQDEDIYKSKLKPENFEYEAKPTVDQTKYWTSIEHAKIAFSKAGFSFGAITADQRISATLPYHANNSARNFFARVDVTQEEISTHIHTMKRQRALEYYKDEKNREKSRVKEYLTYHMEVYGKDWLGNEIKGRLEDEGSCLEPKKRVKITVDSNGRQSAEYVMQGTRSKHYIPFSKKNVDDLLKKYDTDKDTVKFYGLIPLDSNTVTYNFKYGNYTYEQFVNTDWEQFCTIANKWKDKVDIDRKNNPASLLQKGIM